MHLNRLGVDHECYRQTDGRTGGQIEPMLATALYNDVTRNKNYAFLLYGLTQSFIEKNTSSYCSITKECLMRVETVRYQCRTVSQTLRHFRNVRTLRHRSDGAEMSWVRTVLGPKCLYSVYTRTTLL